MSRTKWSLWIMAGTVLAVWMLLTAAAPEPAVAAKIVTVRRGDLEVTVPISGRLAYAEESLAYAPIPGLVAEVCVAPGNRVAAGEALLRLNAEAYESAVSAWIAAQPDDPSRADLQTALESTVVRAPTDATVRQVLTAENAAVMAGTPVVRLSSTRQELRCTVAEADVRQLRVGQWARLSVAGEDIDRIAAITAIGDIEADLTTGQTFASVTLVPDQPIEMPAGAAVDADVYLDGRVDVPLLPVEAVTERGTVWWVCEERCTEIPVKIVLNDEMLAWVDLPEGTAVALGEFKEGQRIMEAKP